MNEEYFITIEEFGLRLARLRENKGVSARQMSLEIGLNKNYINSIESGRNYPNMAHFFEICQYLNISPQLFFQLGRNFPMEQTEFIQALRDLSPQKSISSICLPAICRKNNYFSPKWHGRFLSDNVANVYPLFFNSLISGRSE